MKAGQRATDTPWINAPGKREVDSLVAAAPPASSPTATQGAGPGQGDSWQSQAWQFYDSVGELRYVAQWISSALSRCALSASDVGDDGHPTGETSDRVVIDTVAEIAGGPAGQAALLGRLATFLTVPGDGYVVILYRDGKEEWHVLSREEVKKRADGKVEVLLAGETIELDPATDSVTRVSRPHPRNARETDSPVRAALPILREIIRLGQHIETTAKSRLVGAGLLFVPNEMSLPQAGGPEGERVDSDAPGLPPIAPEDYTPTVSATPSDLSDAIIETAGIAISDPGSAAAATPIVVGVPAEYIGNIQHMKFGLEWADTVLQLREAAIRRLALALDIPPEVMTGMGQSNHWCVDQQTEALTTDGWKRHDQIGVGDTVLTLNHDTGLSEWKPVLDVYRADVVDEPMRHMRTQRHDSITTQAHRWPVLRQRWSDGASRWDREWTTTEDVGTPHKILTGAPAAVPSTATVSDDLVELVAWYWTEGSVTAKGQVTIAQSHTANPERVERIRALLHRVAKPGEWREHIQENRHSFGGPVTVFSIRGEARDALLSVVPGQDKIVPVDWVRTLTGAQLSLFVNTSCEGDGWHWKFGVTDIWQKNPRALDAFELALILMGRSVSRREHAGGECVTALKSTTQRPGKGCDGRREVEMVEYTGTIWCPTTENGTWFARRGGTSYFTGNSAWQVEESAIKIHIEPLLTLICDRLTTALLRPVLEARGVQNPEDYCIWFETTRLSQSPDRGPEALALWDRGLLTNEMVLREHGYDPDTDLPPDAGEPPSGAPSEPSAPVREESEPERQR